MILFQAVLLGLVALILAPGRFFYFDVTPKVVVLVTGVAILLMIATRKREIAPPPRLFSLLLLLNLASLAISTALSSNRSLSLYGSTWRRYGLLVQFAVMLFAWMTAWNTVGRIDRVRTMLRVLSVSGIFSAVYGIAQYFGYDPWIAPSRYHIGEGIWTIVRPPGPLGYASYFATWLAVTVFLSAALGRMETNRWWRAAAYASTAICTVAMLMTGTRAAMVGLAIGMVVWLVWAGFRVPKKALFGAAAVATCAVGFYYSPPGQQLRSRTRWFVEDPWGGVRPLLWRDSLWMGLTHPVFGAGPEVFLSEFPHHESKELARKLPDFVHESPHNIFLDALVSQGLPGLLVLMGLCAAGFMAAWRLKHKHAALAAGLAAALAAALVSQQFTAFTMPTALVFLTVVAMAAGLASQPETPRRLPVFAIVAPFAAVALMYFGVRLAAADVNLQTTRRLLQVGDLRNASRIYERYWFWRLPGTSADIWYSRTWMDLARKTINPEVVRQSVAIADQAAERATETSEEPFAAWYNLAQIRAVLEDSKGTEQALKHAVEAHPNWFKPHWMLAQQYRFLGDQEAAEKEAALAVELNGGRDAEVTQTLRETRGK